MKKKIELQELVVEGIVYVPKESMQKMAEKRDGMEYVLVRSNQSGVHAGYLESKNRDEVVLRDARRIWYWSGAASLSELANKGVSDPGGCKFPAAVDKITVLDVCEIIQVTEDGKNSILGVESWTKH